MATQALYLKYRPQTFDEVVGQDAITQTLRNALRQGKIHHAYLLTGPRGTGKTTTARLLAKAVNCKVEKAEERPCNQCSTCLAINQGRLLDLIEIDAASNRGIDEIRDLREKVGFRPSEGQYKVYVLDEAHMLTEHAFNALLKTLEEPPPHVIFVLVTTDPHKIPATITSRCQRFDFRRISVEAVVGRLALISEKEELTFEPQALEAIARHGTGAMRDSISLLDQLASYGEEITLAQVQMVLGTVASEAASKLATCLVDGDVTGGLDLINRTVSDGADPRQFGRDVIEYLRGLLLIREGAGTRTLNLTDEQAAEMEALAERVPVERLLRSIRLFNDATTDLKRGLQSIPQLPMELALVEMSLQPGELQATTPPVRQGQVLYQTTRRPVAPSKVGAHLGEKQAAAPVVTPAPKEAAAPATTEPSSPATELKAPATAASVAPATAASVAPATAKPAAPTPASAAPAAETVAPAAQTPAGTVSLTQVEGSWVRILQAVRQRNPLVEGALRSECKPVEVYGDEIVIAFPYPFLRDKLGDPRRKDEIQDALTEVLGARCRVKLVLESEYTPRPNAGFRSPPAVPEANAPSADPQAGNPEPAGPVSGPELQDASKPEEDSPPAGSLGDAPPEQAKVGPASDGQTLEEAVSRWAAEHGGETKIVPK